MAYAIMRVSKHKSWGTIGASAAHTYRTRPTPNADPARASENRVGVGRKGEVSEDIRRRLDAVTDKPRTNAVLALELLLTTSPEWMVGKSDREISAWANANTAWLKATFGKANVVHVVLHRDETTPHLVAYVVPEKDGRLNARGLVGTPDLLSGLQTAYAGAMEGFGLERGIKGSTARHQTVRRFYAQVNRAAADTVQQVEELGEFTPPPHVPVWKGAEARQKAVDGWTGQEKGKRKKLVQEAARAVLEASEAGREVSTLRETAASLSAALESTKAQLTSAYEALGLGKEDVAALRRADTTLVAQRLGHLGPVLPKENALDLVKRVGGLDYGQAVAWLHAEFGAVVAGAVVKQSLEAKPPARPFTRADNAIKAAVMKQADGLGCDAYRVSVVPEGEGAKPFLPGKMLGGEERFYSRRELVELIPFLRFENNQGKHIFITPMDDAASYILLDDARLQPAEIKALGLEPCLVQSSSWDRQQLVFKVPKDLDRDAVMAVFRQLNRLYGDETIEGLRHPFRMAGFRNVKAKHERDGQFPFVTVGAAVNRFCTRCTALVEQVIRTAAETANRAAPFRR